MDKNLKGKIVLIEYPYTDLSGSKLRPALVLYDRDLDVVLAFITSRLYMYNEETDVLIKSDSPEFKSTGLEKDSIIKLDKIFTISKEKIKKIIGEVSDNLKNEINRKLQKILML